MSVDQRVSCYPGLEVPGSAYGIAARQMPGHWREIPHGQMIAGDVMRAWGVETKHVILMR